MERSEGKSVTPLSLIQHQLNTIFEILPENKFELYESDGMTVFKMHNNTWDGFSIECPKKYCCFIFLKGTNWSNRMDIPLDFDPSDMLDLLGEFLKSYKYPEEKS